MIYTSQYSFKGTKDKKRLDVAVAAGTIYSPTWNMVGNYKRDGDKALYTSLYHSMMKKSYAHNHDEWKKLLDFSVKNDIVLVCYCASGEFCHRLLLADYFEKVAKSLNINTKYMGEI